MISHSQDKVLCARSFAGLARRAWLVVFFFGLMMLPPMVAAQQTPREVRGRVVDATGSGVAGASVSLTAGRDSSIALIPQTVTTAADGSFVLQNVAAGAFRLTAAGDGFAVAGREISGDVDNQTIEIALEPKAIAEQVVVNGASLGGFTESQERLPGSIETLDRQTLEAARVFTFNEALRKFSGVHVRDEEGFGLRPNIGIRGLNPTRSTKVLLLEDGIPLTFAPYGDNASYYHPPIERYDSIEVMKGAAQILYGPVTVGGVINYLTPTPPEKQQGSIGLTGGTRDYLNTHATYGNRFKSTGFSLDFLRKQGEGSRDNVRSGLNDFNFKTVTPLGARQALTTRFNYFGERSQVTYSGLTEDEYRLNPRGNIFLNDRFYGDRFGASATHALVFSNNLVLSTDFYGSRFNRDWWRQSSNSAQRPNDASDARCGGVQNLNTTCGNEGRLRSYSSFGIAPRVRASYNLFGNRHEADFGARFHVENQNRLQLNGETPTARDGVLREANVRRTNALSAFVQNRFAIGDFSVTPGLRVEKINFRRANNPVFTSNAGTTQTAFSLNDTSLTQLVPGIGIAYNVKNTTTIFAGAHRGFAPPRVEDIINATGGVVDLDPELSWNYEVGFRSRPVRGLQLESTVFRHDYENQIVASSVAGGIGAVLTNGGATLHQGLELTARADSGALFNTAHNFYVRTALTYLPVAEFRGTRFSNLALFNTTANRVSINGNRLPYAPERLANVMLGYSHPRGFNSFIEAVYTDAQFADDLNIVNPFTDARVLLVPNNAGLNLARTGQIGIIPSNTIYNLTTNYESETLRSTFFVTVKNLTNETVIVDRTRGILPNTPRLLQGGIRYRF